MGEQINGVEVKSEDYEIAEVTTVKVTSAEGAKTTGKPVGNYITLESGSLRFQDIDAQLKIAQILAGQLSRIITVGELDSVMVIGLGNVDIESDSLGARTAKKIFVTSHLIDEINKYGESVRPVSVFVPGVRSFNGTETGEIIKGVCDRVKPALVIIVDALAARALERLNTTIQICDTGISPGAGLTYDPAAKDSVINRDLLGVPVISVGVPVVIDVVSLVNGVIGLTIPPDARSGGDYLATLLSSNVGGGKHGKRVKKPIRQILEDDYWLSLVAPKEIGDVAARFADVIAAGINLALHKNLTLDQMRQSVC